jgi:PAS domain S-box-containing protein
MGTEVNVGRRAIAAHVAWAMLVLVLVNTPIPGSAAADSDSPHAQPPNPRVLALHSYHHGFTWTDNISRGIQQAFVEHRDRIELCDEFLDTRRIATDEYFEELEQVFRLKYAERAVDVIICTDDHALNFMLGPGQGVFPGVPLVFCSVSGYEAGMREGRELTGLLESIDIRGTLDIALRIHPGTREVVVITDMTRTGRALKVKADEVFSEYEGDLDFRYLEDLTVDDLERQVQDLSEGSLVFLFIFSRDKAGRVFSHEQNLRRLTAHCQVPIYAVWEFYLGHGIVGGKLTSGVKEGEMVGEIALRILEGESAAEIPLAMSPTEYMFDWSQMERFGIQESDLPDGSVIVNRPFDFYTQYWPWIWGAIAFAALEALLIISLLIGQARRRRAEAARRESEERLDLALQGADLGMWDWNVQTGEGIINSRWAEMLGYRLGEIGSGVDAWENLIHPDDRPQVRKALEDHLGGATSLYEMEYRLRSKAGAWIWVLDRGRVVERDKKGRPLRATGTHLDITERKRVEEERLELERQVQHSQKLESLGILAGGIAHDFNNFLMAILGNADLALRDLSPASPVRSYLEGIETASQRAAELCQQMLAYSGKGRFLVKNLDLGHVVQEMAHMLEVSISKKVTLRYNFDKDVPPVEGDASQIRQVIMNLVINASEAIGSDSGVISISTGAMKCDQEYLRETYLDQDLPDGLYTWIEVSDTGSGMDAETRAKIFDPFFTTKFTGRGLGMAAVLGIVRGHSGAIKVYSEMGKGSTFKVLFPATAADATAGEGFLPSGTVGGDWFSGRVLVVDDEDSVRTLAARMLEKIGFEAITAADGREAVEIYRQHGDRIDWVLLDLTMPNMDGRETLRELRRTNRDVRVMLSSGFNEQDVTQQFAGKGPDAFIQKPYQLDVLVQKVRHLLSPAANDRNSQPA